MCHYDTFQGLFAVVTKSLTPFFRFCPIYDECFNFFIKYLFDWQQLIFICLVFRTLATGVFSFQVVGKFRHIVGVEITGKASKHRVLKIICLKYIN